MSQNAFQKIEELEAELKRQLRGHANLLSEFAASGWESELQLKCLTEEMRGKDRQLESLQQELLLLRFKVAELDAREEIAAYKSHLLRVQAVVAEQREELAQARENTAALEAESEARAKLIEQRERENGSLRQQKVSLNTDLTSLRAYLADTQERLRARESEAETMRIEFEHENLTLKRSLEATATLEQAQRDFTLEGEKAERSLRQVEGEGRLKKLKTGDQVFIRQTDQGVEISFLGAVLKELG